MFRTITISILFILLNFPVLCQKIVQGSGYVLTQQRETGYFNSIEVSNHISVYIVQGELQPITVEADNNLFPYIKTIIRDQTLKIYIPDTVKIIRFADMNILISMPALLKLQAYQSSYINGSPQMWQTKNIQLYSCSGSRIKLAVQADDITLIARTSGTIELKGKTDNMEATLKTAAQLYAKDMEIEKANLQLATGARAEIKVNQEIRYDLCGNSRLVYRGSPRIANSEVNTGSKVVKER